MSSTPTIVPSTPTRSPAPTQEGVQLTSFAQLKFVRVHNLLPETNSLYITCSMRDSPEQENVLLIVQHAAWSTDAPRILVEGGLEGLMPGTISQQLQHNQKYYQYLVHAAPSVVPLKVQMIYPASKSDFDKYAPVERIHVRETAALYQRCTKPWIAEKLATDNIQWVANILEGRAEQERLIYSDPDETTGFVLAPDTKWDQVNMQSLYCLGISRMRGIATLRDLTGAHLPLLEKMASEGRRRIQAKYGVAPESILCFVHYLPSFFHFHVHYVSTGFYLQAASRSLLLEDIIDALRADPDHFQKCALSLVLPTTRHPLTPALLDAIRSQDRA
ncbi:putative Scavenger mRNA decapping enzyme [Paratrimastix pyriformis]|uniref:Scavenger mRNA decapping enzyme n=1 Tax=Paratrimastix pyriformis TaxID=342808 RepID=A0ABQ8UPB1_9EUKA|nr:putative Scavenger mRNA decapping enzyme [Paratrimastix pyriformis]